MFKLSRKATVIAGVAAGSLLIGTGALAFVLGHGSDTNSNAGGNAQAGNTVNVTVANTTGTLTPGGGSITYAVTVKNPGANAVQVPTQGTWTVAVLPATGSCPQGGDAALTSSLSKLNGSSAANLVLTKNDNAAGGTDEATATVTVSMPDSTTQDQTACVGAPVSVSVSY